MGRGGRRGQKWKLLVSMLVLKVSMVASFESMMAENAGEHPGCMAAMAVGRFGGQDLKRLTSSVKLPHASHVPGWFHSVCNRSSHD